MPTQAATLAPAISPADRETYRRDGAIVLRNVLDSAWIERMRPAIARLHAQGPDAALWMARMDPDFAAFAADSGLAAVAGAMMGVDRVRFFYDQLFVKPSLSSTPTPLHQDLPYWPVEGEDIISVWAPFDRVTRESSVVQYVKGSHLWGRMFEPVPFRPDSDIGRANVVGSAGYEEIHDPAALIAENEVLHWELGPGDVLIHHPLTLHFATPNLSPATTRRAIALRYVGPDCRLVDRPGNFMRRAGAPAWWPPRPTAATAMEGPDYPQVWES